MTNQTPITLRTPQEIQRAHDILTAILLNELPIPIDASTRADIHATCDALCWVLQHDHNDTFIKNMQRIQQWAQQNGYILQDQGSPQPHPNRPNNEMSASTEPDE